MYTSLSLKKIANKFKNHLLMLVFLCIWVLPSSAATTVQGKSDELWGFGDNYYGQLANGTFTSYVESSYITPVKIMDSESGIVDINLCSHSTYFLKKDGSLWACGGNSGLQLGFENEKDDYKQKYATPIKIVDSGVSLIYKNGYNFLKTDGCIYETYYPIKKVPFLNDKLNEKNISVKSIINSIPIGGQKSFSPRLFIIGKDGSLWEWLKPSEKNPSYILNNIMDEGVVSLSTNGQTAFVVKKDGSLWAFGDNEEGKITPFIKPFEWWNTPVKIIDSGVSSIEPGSGLLIIKTDGSLWSRAVNQYNHMVDSFQITAVPLRDKTAPIPALAELARDRF